VAALHGLDFFEGTGLKSSRPEVCLLVSGGQADYA
jgi:hypothetical protein